MPWWNSCKYKTCDMSLYSHLIWKCPLNQFHECIVGAHPVLYVEPKDITHIHHMQYLGQNVCNVALSTAIIKVFWNTDCIEIPCTWVTSQCFRTNSTTSDYTLESVPTGWPWVKEQTIVQTLMFSNSLIWSRESRTQSVERRKLRFPAELCLTDRMNPL